MEGIPIKTKTVLGIVVIIGLLLSTAAAMAATPLLTNVSDNGSSEIHTYIIGFNDDKGSMSAMAEQQVSGLLDSFNGRIVHKFSVINGMAVTMPDNKVSQLKSIKGVKYVEMDQEVHVLLDKAVPQITADQVWSAGYKGKGVKVCVIDTGIDASHADLNGGKVVGWVDYVAGKTSPYDDHGHGTHCAGTIAGTGAASSGKYKGVAPEASLMGAKVLGKDGSGSTTNIIKGIDWAVKNGADVISMSLGGSHSQASDDAVNNAIKAGVVVVVAAGNSGPGARTVACPGDNPNAITVGACDRNDAIASFSSRGPNRDGSVKPDVTNMGVGLVAPRATGTSQGKPVDSYYTALSGTSMATPMTAGTVALLLSAKPDLTPAQVKEVLTKTAKPLGGSVPNNDYGYGRVQAKAALDYALSGKLPTPTPTPTPDPNNPTPTPTPTPAPGNYAVKLTNMFAKYNGKVGQMSSFQVKPGTTLEQSGMVSNIGDTADAYDIVVTGIPASWYTIGRYGGGTLEPNSAAYLILYIQPDASAAAGSYKITMTAKSLSDPSVTSSLSYTLNVAAGTTPPIVTPTPTPRPSPTPTPIPGTPGEKAFAGTVSKNDEYYTYIVPAAAGQVTAKISWASSSDDLNAYLYSPNGELVAKAETRYTNTETINYNATTGGYYLLKVTTASYRSNIEFSGTTNRDVYAAYETTGQAMPGQTAAYTFHINSPMDITALLTWGWTTRDISVTLEDKNGNTIAYGDKHTRDFRFPYEWLAFEAGAAGDYRLCVSSYGSTGTASFKLVTPYRLSL